MIDTDDGPSLSRNVGRRLLITRRALRFQQEEFAAGAGLSQPRYNPYETGKRILTIEAALRLCERYQLTMDWLYRGDPSGLPYRLAEAIKVARRG